MPFTFLPAQTFDASGTYGIVPVGTPFGPDGYLVRVTGNEWTGNIVLKVNQAPPGSALNLVNVAYQNLATRSDVAAGTPITGDYFAIVPATGYDLYAVATVTVGTVTLNISPAEGIPESGSADIGFIQEGTGAVERTVEAKLREVQLSVTDFGAAGDGVTDDTAAIQAACDQAFALGGGTVWFPVGVYMISSIGVRSRVRLMGDGTGQGEFNSQGNVVLRNIDGTLSAGEYMVSCTDTDNALDESTRVEIYNLTIDAVARARGIHGIKPGRISVFEGLYLSKCDSGIGPYYGKQMQIRRCKFAECNYGMDGAVDSLILQCYFISNTTAGIRFLTGANDNVVMACKVEFNDVDNIVLFEADNNVIVGNVIDRADERGIEVSGCDNVTITGNQFRRNGSDDGTADVCCHIYLNNSDRISITGNTTRVGVDDDGGGNNTPKVAVYINGDVNDTTITGNNLAGHTASAFSVNGTNANLTLVGNVPNERDSGAVGEGVFAGRQRTTGNIANAATASITIYDTAIGTTTNKLRVLHLAGRDTVTGADYGARLPVLFQREAGGASVTLGTVSSDFGTTFSTSASGVQVAISNIATDGSSYQLDFTNHEANTQNVWAVVS